MRPEPCWLRERLWSSYYFLGVGKATAMVSHDKGPLTPVALTEANLEARDFRLDYAARVLQAFKQGFGPGYKRIPTAAGLVHTPCDPVLPDCPHGEYTWN